MNTLSHIDLGNVIHEYLKTNQKIFLNKTSFIYGNVKPDLLPQLFIVPHLKESLFNFIKEELAHLSDICIENTEKIDAAYSERLGVVCHYISDFFCRVHNPEEKINLLNHVQYEMKLSKYIKNRRQIIEKINFSLSTPKFHTLHELIMRIESMNEEYLKSSKIMGMDALYSTQICIELIIAVTNFSVINANKYLEVSEHANSLLYGHLLS